MPVMSNGDAISMITKKETEDYLSKQAASMDDP